MALEGSLTDFGLADILQLIYFQRKTGVLTLEGRMDKVRLLFIEGNISAAESKRRTEDNRLGKILVKKGLITESDLRSILEEQKGSGCRFANLVLRRNLVGKEIIKEILQGQITETVTQIFGWKEGTYEFASQGVPQDKELTFTVDTQHLLMEGLRVVDEWSLIKGKITLDTVFKRSAPEPPELTAEENEIFSCVDGENDVSTIIDLVGKDNFQVSRVLLGLMEKGIIEAVSAAPVAVPEKKEPSKAMAFLLPLVLLAAAVFSLSSFVTDRTTPYKAVKTTEAIGELRLRIETYRISHGVYPQDLSQVSGDKDPWGRPYIYGVSGNTFFLRSAGPDGIEGTSDDLY
jgi:hypothetical protein